MVRKEDAIRQNVPSLWKYIHAWQIKNYILRKQCVSKFCFIEVFVEDGVHHKGVCWKIILFLMVYNYILV